MQIAKLAKKTYSTQMISGSLQELKKKKLDNNLKLCVLYKNLTMRRQSMAFCGGCFLISIIPPTHIVFPIAIACGGMHDVYQHYQTMKEVVDLEQQNMLLDYQITNV